MRKAFRGVSKSCQVCSSVVFCMRGNLERRHRSHFGSSHFSQTWCCFAHDEVWLFHFCPLIRRCVMPRRGWSTMEVPDGWLQLIRGPRPKSERWPRRTPQTHQKPAPAVRQPGVQGGKGPRVPAKLAMDPAQRVSPDTARAAAQEKARKLEKALEVMSDVEGPVVDALRAKSKKVQSAAVVPALDVHMEQCESFISKSQRWLAELDKQRVAEEELLTEARARLERLRLEAEQCRAASSATPNVDSELLKSWSSNVPQPQFFRGQPQCGWEMVHLHWTMCLHCPLPISRTWNIG